MVSHDGLEDDGSLMTKKRCEIDPESREQLDAIACVTERAMPPGDQH